MLRVEQAQQIFRLATCGLKTSTIARELDVSVTTVYRYLDNKGKKRRPKKSRAYSTITPYKKYIEKRIEGGLNNGNKLYLELKSRGYKGTYITLRRYLNESSADSKSNYRFPRIETKPGEQAQVDWGYTGKIVVNGKIRKLYCFVYTLCYSRASYVEFTIRQNLQTLENCHIHAFKKLGVPTTILYDNMKTVILGRVKLPDGKENLLQPNAGFKNFSKFYDFEPVVCKPRRPQTKGKVENGVGYVKNHFMQAMRFGKDYSSLEELNQKVTLWLDNIANERIHGTTKEKPRVRWEREKSSLSQPPNVYVYQTAPFLERYATKDGRVQYKNNYYEVPMQFARKKLQVREINESGIAYFEIYYQYKQITKHLLSEERGKWIDLPQNEKFTALPAKNSGRKISKMRDRLKNIYIPVRSLSYYEKFIPKY